MKSIGFIGKIDKTELIGYISKVVAAMGNKVIMLDATSNQKTRYIAPTIEEIGQDSQYVVQYDNIDIAVGFSNMLELKKYLLSKGEDFNQYDYIMIDTDREEMIEEYDLKNANALFFASSYDKFYIHKGIDLLKFLCAMKRQIDPDGVINICKVLFSSDINTADTRYFEHMCENLPIVWKEKFLSFPYDQGDFSVNIQNQYIKKFDIARLSKYYKEGLADAVEIITEENPANVKKVLKNVEKYNRFSV